MVIGSCPWEDCSEPLMRSMPESPALEKHDCEGCGREIWTLLSRWTPWSMTADDFHEQFRVDEATRSVEWVGEGDPPYPFPAP